MKKLRAKVIDRVPAKKTGHYSFRSGYTIVEDETGTQHNFLDRSLNSVPATYRDIGTEGHVVWVKSNGIGAWWEFEPENTTTVR